MNEISCFIGLGNPGSLYKYTRHNIGALIIENFLEDKKAARKRIKGNVIWKVGEIIFARPLLYMNNSGRAVLSLINTFSISPDRILVIHDDLSLKFGRIKISPQGGSGGHKGVESIIQQIGTDKFPRMKIGIGPLPKGSVMADFVLENFNKDELQLLPLLLDSTKEIIEDIINFGILKTMGEVNRKYR